MVAAGLGKAARERVRRHCRPRQLIQHAELLEHIDASGARRA